MHIIFNKLLDSIQFPFEFSPPAFLIHSLLSLLISIKKSPHKYGQ